MQCLPQNLEHWIKNRNFIETTAKRDLLLPKLLKQYNIHQYTKIAKTWIEKSLKHKWLTIKQFNVRMADHETQDRFLTLSYCFFARTIPRAILFYQKSPRLPIWCWLSNGLYVKTIRIADLPSSKRASVNLTSNLRCNGTAMDMHFCLLVSLY